MENNILTACSTVPQRSEEAEAGCARCSGGVWGRAPLSLDIKNIGRIGQMFLSGDLLEDVLKNPLTCEEDDFNYNIPAFNELKIALSKIERLNPDLDVSGILWQWYPANKRMVAPAVCGKKLPDVPAPSWMIMDCPAPMRKAMEQDKYVRDDKDGGSTVWYFPIKTSAGDVVGALSLTQST